MPEIYSMKRDMREAFAVTGYVPDKDLQEPELGRADNIDVRVERGSDEVVMRIKQADIAEVRTGASIENESLVQVILRPDAVVETIIKAQANFEGAARFNDPILQRLTATATAKPIAV